MRRKIILAALALLIILFILFPDIVSNGAENGLALWFGVVIPSLLPFMIVSTMFIKLGVTKYISSFFYPVFNKILRLSKNGCYPAVIGMLSGYPLGAKTVADMYERKAYSKNEAQYLLCFCNNASPMFMLEYVGVKCLGLKQPALILIIIYLSAFINAKLCFYKHENEHGSIGNTSIKTENCSVMQALDDSILSSAVTLVKVGGYIILFSILTELLGNMMRVPLCLKIVGSSVLEITTGCRELAEAQLTEYVRYILVSASCAFGGFSSVAQTSSVIMGTDLSVSKYIKVKIRQAAIAAVIAALVGYMIFL